MRFGILVDAACDVPGAFIAANPVRVLPIPIRIGSRLIVDDRDEAATRQFYARVLAAGITDVESVPLTETEVEALFLERLVLDFDYVIGLTINARQSPVFERAQKASFQVLTKYKSVRAAAGVDGPFAVRLFDTGNVCAAQGVQVLELARLIRAGTPVTRTFRRLDEIVPQTCAYVVPADLRYAHARARRSGAGSVGQLGHAWGRALDLKPIMRCQRGETRAVGKVRGFTAAADRVFANVTREIERGLVAPFVNLSCGGDWTGITRRSAYQAMARAASARGVDVHWSHLSMTAGVDLGPGALTVGIVAQPHEFV